MTQTSDLVLVDDSDPRVRIITLNRPDKRNALSVDLIEALTTAVREAEGGDRRVLIVRAEGPVFCAGLDLKEAASGEGRQRSAEGLYRLYAALAQCPLVTIAAAQGAAMGGGAGLLLACDLAVSADNLVLGFPEVHRGLVAALVTCLLTRQLGQRAVRELVLLGRSIDAQESLQLGLLTHIVHIDRLMDEAMSMARQVLQGAPGAIARTKRLLDELSARPLVEDLGRALAYHVEARNSPEAEEGLAAFMEKRPPRWGQ